MVLQITTIRAVKEGRTHPPRSVPVAFLPLFVFPFFFLLLKHAPVLLTDSLSLSPLSSSRDPLPHLSPCHSFYHPLSLVIFRPARACSLSLSHPPRTLDPFLSCPDSGTFHPSPHHGSLAHNKAAICFQLNESPVAISFDPLR